MSEENPYNKIPWAVQVVGPDDVLACRSFEQAVESANKINERMVAFKNSEKCSHLHPVVYAKVIEWRDVFREAPHRPDQTVWDDYLPSD